MKNRPEFKWYVVNVNTISIDSGWRDLADATERMGKVGSAKVMTKPRVGSVVLDPNDDASWIPKRNNPQMKQRVVTETRVVRTVTRGPLKKVRRNPGELLVVNPEVGSYVVRNGTTRVFQVDGVDETGAVICDVATGECFRVPLDEFSDFVEARENPAWMGRDGDSRFTDTVQHKGRWFTISTNIYGPKNREIVGSTQETLVFPSDANGNYNTARECWGRRGPGSHKMALEHLDDAYARLLEQEQEDEAGREVYENPGELLILNPREVDSARAEKVYQMWHQKEPHNISVKRPGVDMGDVMLCVGHAHNIVYRSGKWEAGRKTNDYVHHFDSKPKVWMLERVLSDEDLADVRGAAKTVDDLFRASLNADGQCAVADLAAPISFGLDDGTSEGIDISIHSGARVYGAVDRKTVIIFDPIWKIVVVKGGRMTFDERGIVK